MRFSDQFLDELASRCDIIPIASQYVQLKPAGRLYTGLCPFHGEKTPSFYIYPESNSYYCFGCGNGGSVIRFVQNIENLTFTDAVRSLCERCGMPMPVDDGRPDDSRLRRRCWSANRDAAKFYHSMLYSDKGAVAREYINKRALTKETVTHFGLGYAPDEWDALVKHLKTLGYNEQELVAFNLARMSSRGRAIDAFRNRLMFPIIDLRGNVVGFGGRVLDDSKPKYVNTSDTIVFNKTNELFALNFAKNAGTRRLILCEGYMDVIALHQAGFTEAVAGLGTSFTRQQALLLARYADEVLLCFDADEAGQKATKRALAILDETTLRVRVLKISGGKDPDEIIRTHGRGAMAAVIDGAQNDTEYRLSSAVAGIDPGTEDGKLRYFSAALPVIASLDNAVERDLYLTKLCSQLDISKVAAAEQLDKELKKLRRSKARQTDDDARRSLRPVRASGNSGVSKLNAAEEVLLSDLLLDPSLIGKLSDRLSRDIFITDQGARLYDLISRRASQGESLSAASLESELEPDDAPALAAMFARSGDSALTVGECLKCIQKLKDDKLRQNGADVGNMSRDDFAKLIAEISKKKNGD